MRKRVIITTVVSFVLLLLVIMAGLNAVYTVTSVRASFQTSSAEGESEAGELQKKLDSFINKSAVFLDLDKVRAMVEEYPCFRLEEAKKRYPDKLELKIRERKETFACPLENGKYAVLDDAGEYLYEKDTDSNRTDGGKNILLSGFGFSFQSGVEGKYYAEFAATLSVFRKALSEVRSNVLSIELVRNTTMSQYDRFAIRMREGVLIEIRNPQEKTAEKAQVAIERYLGVGAYEGNGLTDAQLVRGTLTVYDSAEGVSSNYTTSVIGQENA